MSTPTSSQASINSTAPARSYDPAWRHGTIDPTNKNYIRCLHCDKLIKGGGVTRLKEHLGGVTGAVAPCKEVSPDVKWQMERLVKDSRRNRDKKKKKKTIE